MVGLVQRHFVLGGSSKRNLEPSDLSKFTLILRHHVVLCSDWTLAQVETLDRVFPKPPPTPPRSISIHQDIRFTRARFRCEEETVKQVGFPVSQALVVVLAAPLHLSAALMS